MTNPDSPFAAPPVAPIIMKTLLKLPDEIYACQKVFDGVNALYEARLSDLSFKALSTMMFPGKDSSLRVAANEDERKIATSQVIAADEKMKILRRELDEARNDLALVKNHFEAAKIVAQLLAAK